MHRWWRENLVSTEERYLARFDLDGDWRGDNKLGSCRDRSSQGYVYYAAMETSTHWFLIYNFFTLATTPTSVSPARVMKTITRA